MALFSTTYFGNIYYYAKLVQSDNIMIEAHENYTKQSYRNRATIAAANGKIDLTVPIIKESGSKTPINRVGIDYSTRWMVIHERSIVSAYKNSPYFDHYFDLFQPHLTHRYDTLFEMNCAITESVLKVLKHKKELLFTDSFIEKGVENDDYRYSISPKITVEQAVFPLYYQVFSEKMEFIPNLSILDLLFCEGNQSLYYLNKI